MGIKRRNKIQAQFNMSSLTDIIFLLLIFFMLTSSLIVPNALNLKLPGDNRSTVTVSERPDEVLVFSNGQYLLNGDNMKLGQLSSALWEIRKVKGRDSGVIVTADRDAKNQYVVSVLDAIRKAGLSAILNETAN